MNLTFLGRGAAFFAREGNTSAYLREGEKLLLLDCGESVFGRLKETRALEGVRSVTVMLSHLHSDHCGSLATLALYCKFALGGAEMRLFLPEDPVYRAQVRELLNINGCDESCYCLCGAADGFAAFTQARYVPTEHTPGMRCFSFVFETPAGAVFYSGDTANTAALRRFMQEYREVSCIYMDVTDGVPGGVHASLSEICAVIPPEMRSRVQLMHFNSSDCIIKSASLGFQIVKTCRND